MRRFFTILVCGVAMLLGSCGDGEEIDLLDILEDDRAAIEEYLAQVTTPIVTVPKYSRTGQLIDSLYIFNYTESASKPAHGDCLLLDYSQTRLDGVCDDSTFPDREVVDSLYVNGGPIYHWVSDSLRYDYYADAARVVGAEGAECDMLVPMQLVLTNGEGTTRVWHLKFYRLIEDLPTYELELIDGYVRLMSDSTLATYTDTQGDTVTTHTLVTREGTGARAIQPGDTVTYAYTAHILDEVHMEDSLRMVMNPGTQTLVFNASASGTPAGFLLGMQHLREGDAAEIVIPSAMAYGASEQRTTNWRRIRIPAYSTLVYRVRVDEVKAAAAQETPPAE